ncbi:MAG: hypothetical protein ACKPKO_00295, partial [Candidatus Fonsibacter sp.]
MFTMWACNLQNGAAGSRTLMFLASIVTARLILALTVWPPQLCDFQQGDLNELGYVKDIEPVVHVLCRQLYVEQPGSETFD